MRLPGSEKNVNRFLRSDLALLALSAISLIVIGIFDAPFLLPCIIASIVSFLMVFFGRKLNEDDTTENWLVFSVTNSVKNVIGWILIVFGWIIFLRMNLAIAIASLILFFS